MEDREFEEILTYLSRGKYPEVINTKDLRSNWRKKCRPFTHYKCKLYYNHKKYGALLVVKGLKNKMKIIEINHIKSDEQHMGINKTLKTIICKYYWKTIVKDVHNYIKLECTTCIKQALQQQKKQTEIVPDHIDEEASPTKSSNKIVDKAIEQIGVDVIGTILEPGIPPARDSASSSFKREPEAQVSIQASILRDRIMAHCGLDILGPLSETHKGKRFIVILTDCVTKWVEAKALGEFTTDEVGDFISDVMCRHGVIEEVLTKHNLDFCNRLTDKVCSTIGITLQMSNVPHQSNGYLEHYWYNNLLCGALIKYSNQNPYYWDIYLNKVVLAYRTFTQKNSMLSPFQLMYDRPVRLPVMGLSQPTSNVFPEEEDALLTHMTNYTKALSATHQSVVNVSNDRINTQFVPQNACIISSNQLQPPQVLGSYSQTESTRNQLNSNVSIITAPASNLQTSVHSNATVQTASSITSNNSLTVPSSTTNGMTHNTNGMTHNTLNIQNLAVNSLGTHTVSTNALPTYSVSANSVNNQSTLTTNNPVITTQAQAAATHVITSQVSTTGTQSAAVQAPAHFTTPSNTDTHTGHMVMIHTDGKTYPEPFYVICHP